MAKTREGRFVYVDGLRGIAALAVVLFHFNEAVGRQAANWIPGALEAVLRRGFLGVEIFFVISGFVIAFSVRDGNYTPGYLFRFWLRRSIRLDPPYWATIAVEIGLIAFCLWLIPSLGTWLPGTREVIAHLFYAQNIIGYREILPIFWTLCYEVQFYLFVVTLLMVWQAVRPRLGARAQRIVPIAMLAVLFLASLITRYTPYRLPVHGIALDRWFQFFLGVLVWWAVSGKVTAKVLPLAWAVLAGFILATRQPVIEQSLAIVVSASLLLAASLKRLETWLNWRPVQFLGKISYSLYLFHLPIGWRFIALCEHLIGKQMSVFMAWAVFLGGIVVSIVAAALSYWVLESPSMRLSKRIRLPSRHAPQVAERPPTHAAPGLAPVLKGTEPQPS
jgi:peptidoglycan/LPS O-acetylase OafA/YrhL